MLIFNNKYKEIYDATEYCSINYFNTLYLRNLWDCLVYYAKR